MKRAIKKGIKLLQFLYTFPLAVLFYPKVIKHNDYNKYDSPGWDRIRKCWYRQKIRGKNRRAIWPTTDLSLIGEPNNLVIDETSEGALLVSGLYLQCMDAKVIIGKNVYIAPNVGIITANHNCCDLDHHLPGKDVIIGDNSWIGMNSVILPGVVLGEHTVVGAGSVVTKSFPAGYIVIAGSPAKMIRAICKNRSGENI